jgi:hypothetical protein
LLSLLMIPESRFLLLSTAVTKHLLRSRLCFHTPSTLHPCSHTHSLLLIIHSTPKLIASILPFLHRAISDSLRLLNLHTTILLS